MLWAAYNCTIHTYFWRARLRSDARRVREPDHRVSPQRWVDTDRSTSYSWCCSWRYSWTHVSAWQGQMQYVWTGQTTESGLRCWAQHLIASMEDCLQDWGGLHAGLSRTACRTEHSYVEGSISHTVRFIHGTSGRGQTRSLLGLVKSS